MDYSKLFPLLNSENEKIFFNSCQSLPDFLNKVTELYFETEELRVKESCLAVFVAFKDHYPSYLKFIDPFKVDLLESDLKNANSKIIKLRRIVLSELKNVA